MGGLSEKNEGEKGKGGFNKPLRSDYSPRSGRYSKGLSKFVHPILSAIFLLYSSTEGSVRGSAVATAQIFIAVLALSLAGRRPVLARGRRSPTWDKEVIFSKLASCILSERAVRRGLWDLPIPSTHTRIRISLVVFTRQTSVNYL